MHSHTHAHTLMHTHTHTGLHLHSLRIHKSNVHTRTYTYAHTGLHLPPRQLAHPQEQHTHIHTHLRTHTHTGLHLHLDSLRIHKSNVLGKGPEYVGNTLVDATAKIGSGCLIGEFSFPLCALFASVYVFCLCMCVFVCVCVCLSPFHIAMTHLALSNCSH
jgi:hypothetical protein